MWSNTAYTKVRERAELLLLAYWFVRAFVRQEHLILKKNKNGQEKDAERDVMKLVGRQVSVSLYVRS